MHPILGQFLDKWVWPTMPGAPGADFRLRLTREKCLKGWEISLQRTLGEIEEELGRNASTVNCMPTYCSAKAGSKTNAS